MMRALEPGSPLVAAVGVVFVEGGRILLLLTDENEDIEERGTDLGGVGRWGMRSKSARAET